MKYCILVMTLLAQSLFLTALYWASLRHTTNLLDVFLLVLIYSLSFFALNRVKYPSTFSHLFIPVSGFHVLLIIPIKIKIRSENIPKEWVQV